MQIALLLSMLGQLEDTIARGVMSIRCCFHGWIPYKQDKKTQRTAEEGVDVVAENVADLAAVNKQMDTKVDGDIVEVDVRNSAQNIRPVCAWANEHNDPDGKEKIGNNFCERNCMNSTIE